MKYLPLIWAGLWRKRLRTIFTLLSIVTAFLLFGLLQGVNATFSGLVNDQHLNRLFVLSRISLIESLPVAQMAQIERVPGVTTITKMNYFGGIFQDPKNQINAYSVDIDSFAALYPEFAVSKEQVSAMAHTRAGAIVYGPMAAKYGWKIGDRIPLRSTIWTKADGTSDWEFDIVGIYNSADSSSLFLNCFFLNSDYFDEARGFGKGTAGWYVIGIDDPNKSVQVADTIDKLFANSSDETKTQSEKLFTQARLKQIGNITIILDAIIFAVFFTLLFLTGNTMMQSVRERVPELAVLKTLGFSDRGVLTLVFAESLALCLLAALVGLAGAAIVYPQIQVINGATMQLPVTVPAWGVLAALLLALATGMPPAWRAMRVQIVDALAAR